MEFQKSIWFYHQKLPILGDFSMLYICLELQSRTKSPTTKPNRPTKLWKRQFSLNLRQNVVFTSSNAIVLSVLPFSPMAIPFREIPNAMQRSIRTKFFDDSLWKEKFKSAQKISNAQYIIQINLHEM